MNGSAAQGAYRAVSEFFAQADVRPEFAARAQARIQAHDDELGTSFLWSSLSMLVDECAAEAEDLGAWASLIAARLEHDATGSFADKRARALLTAATQRAAEADVLLCELRRLVERAA
jgi:hypothetical protein